MDKGLFYELIRKPIITEKSNKLLAEGKVTFKVASFATKLTVKKAIESIFSVKVDDINIYNKKGKIKVFRGRIGNRANQKYAIVTLQKGENIDLGIGA